MQASPKQNEPLHVKPKANRPAAHYILYLITFNSSMSLKSIDIDRKRAGELSTSLLSEHDIFKSLLSTIY